MGHESMSKVKSTGNGAVGFDGDDVSIDAIQKALFAAPEDDMPMRKPDAPQQLLGGQDFDVQPDLLQKMLAQVPEEPEIQPGGVITMLTKPIGMQPPSFPIVGNGGIQTPGLSPLLGGKPLFPAAVPQVVPTNFIAPVADSSKEVIQAQPNQRAQPMGTLEEKQDMMNALENLYNQKTEEIRQLSDAAADTEEATSQRRKRKRKPGLEPGKGAKALKYPQNKPFAIGLERPLLELLAPGGTDLDSLKHQKLQDATTLLQENSQHVLEPLTLYRKNELFELMASIAEAWKNSGKGAWKKRINKIKENARYRKAPRNELDEKEKKMIEELQAKIREREAWERREKLKLKLAKGMSKSSPVQGNFTSSSPISNPGVRSTPAFSTPTPNSTDGHPDEVEEK